MFAFISSDKSLCSVILEEWATLRRLPESRWSARPIFRFTSALMQRHCENTVVCDYQAGACKLAPVNTRGWGLWEARQKRQNGLFFGVAVGFITVGDDQQLSTSSCQQWIAHKQIFFHQEVNRMRQMVYIIKMPANATPPLLVLHRLSFSHFND